MAFLVVVLVVSRSRESRVPKYFERLPEKFNFDRRELAVLCLLLLRGPQTPGELRGRSQRLYEFDDLESVEATLTRLMEREPEPLVKRLAKQPGTKEARYAHLFSGDVPDTFDPTAPAPLARHGSDDRVAKLEEESERSAKKWASWAQFAEFRKQFEHTPELEQIDRRGGISALLPVAWAPPEGLLQVPPTGPARYRSTLRLRRRPSSIISRNPAPIQSTACIMVSFICISFLLSKAPHHREEIFEYL